MSLNAKKSGDGGRRKKRNPRKITPRYLENAALAYLGRYASSSQNLRRILMRRVNKSCAFHGTDVEECAAMVDALIARYLESGILNDEVYARASATTMRRRGLSRRAISAKLGAKGLPGEQIEQAVAKADDMIADEYDDELDDPELRAARRFAQRKRIGPYRKKDRAERHERDMAAMARAGFGYGVVRALFDMDIEDEDLSDF